MGNCNNLDNHLQSLSNTIRFCTNELDEEKIDGEKIDGSQPILSLPVISYPTSEKCPYSKPDTFPKETIFNDSFLKNPSEFQEDPYLKNLESSYCNKNEKYEEKFEFKLLTLRASLHSVISDSFVHDQTQVDDEINFQNKSLNVNFAEAVSQIYENNVEPMNRDRMASSRLNYMKNMKSPGTKKRKSMIHSIGFASPFKKTENSPTKCFNKFKSRKVLNDDFFTKSIEFLGPFDYTLSEDFLSKNPSFLEFLQSIRSLPIDPPRELENKAIYIGQMKNGQKNGKGRQNWPDGSFYEGYWFHDMAHGKGRLIHSKGTIYEGYWALDQAHGSGLYLTKDGSFYKGDWFEDKQHGFGVEKWENGAIYEGNYFMGMKHGKGVFKWEDNSNFNGDFHENVIQGKGIYHWNDGREYNGEWLDNKMNGKGVFKWPDGRIYSGNYVNDEKNGIGIFFWPDGSLYKGFWKDGKQNGMGKFIDGSGNEMEGNWVEGVAVE